MRELLKIVGVLTMALGLLAGLPVLAFLLNVREFQYTYLTLITLPVGGLFSGVFLLVIAGMADDLHALRLHAEPEPLVKAFPLAE